MFNRNYTRYVMPCWLLLVLLISACKKEADTTPGIAGKYKTVYAKGSDTLPAYYLFYDDKTYAVLKQSNEGGRVIDRGTYKVQGNSLLMSRYYVTLYQLKYAGDTLKLLSNPEKGDSYSGNVVMVKDNAAPMEEEWVTTISITSKFIKNVYSNSSLAYNAGELWGTPFSTTGLRRYNSTTGDDLPPVVTADVYNSIEFTGGQLWGIRDVSSGTLDKLNPATGAIIMSAPSPSISIYHMASDGTNIYCSDANNSRMIVYNIATNTFGSEVNLGSRWSDMAFKGGYLYLHAYNYIYKMDPATFRIVKNYRLKDIESSSGLATDGTAFYTYVSNEVSTPGYFVKFYLD